MITTKYSKLEVVTTCYDCGTISDKIVNVRPKKKPQCPECESHNTSFECRVFRKKKECNRCKGRGWYNEPKDECTYCSGSGLIDHYGEGWEDELDIFIGAFLMNDKEKDNWLNT